MDTSESYENAIYYIIRHLIDETRFLKVQAYYAFLCADAFLCMDPIATELLKIILILR